MPFLGTVEQVKSKDDTTRIDLSMVMSEEGDGGGWEDDPKLQPEKDLSPLERFGSDWSKTQIPVEVKLIYIRHLADVDTVNQSFKIAVGFDMQWPSTEQDVQNWQKDPVKFVPSFVPNFEFPNAKEETKERRNLENGNPFQIQEVDGAKYNFLRTLVYLTCIERLELHSFPFDVQELTLIMDMSFAPMERAMFVPSRGAFPKPVEKGKKVAAGKSSVILSTADFNAPLLILNRQYCTIPDFDVLRTVVQFKNACYEGEDYLDENTFKWSQVVIRIQMKRHSSGYLYRIGLYNFLLMYTSCCAFALEPKDGLEGRIGFMITLILAAVAFQFIVSQSLPNVSYLTVLDKYTLSVFVICVLLLGVVCGLAKLDVSAEVRAKYDSYTLLVYVSILTLVQVGFYVYGWMLRKKQMEHFDMGELDLRKLNYKPEKDDPINVVKKGLLPESEKPMASGDASAFISFAGSAHNIIS